MFCLAAGYCLISLACPLAELAMSQRAMEDIEEII